MLVLTGRLRVFHCEIRTSGLHELSLPGLGRRRRLAYGAVFDYCHTWLRHLPFPRYTWKHTTGKVTR